MTESVPPSPSGFRCDLQGRTALITGASRGLGARIAGTLARAGASVALTARAEGDLREVERRIRNSGGTAHCFPQDLTRTDRLGVLLDRVEAECGPLSILVNNAGTSVVGRAIDASSDHYQRMMTSNVEAPFFLSSELARRLIARRASGSIINIASVVGESPRPGLALYCMSKASAIMMTRVLAKEWARYAINVNAILPGYLMTEMTRAWFESDAGRQEIASFRRRRLMEPRDLDAVVLLLASSDSRAITGATIVVDDAQAP